MAQELLRISLSKRCSAGALLLIEMRALSKIYRHGLVETYAIRNLSVKIRDGEFVTIAGVSGSGKTTFLNVVGLLDGFTQGAYFLANVDVSGLNDVKLAQLRNENIGFIFQSCNLLPDLDVFDNCAMPLRYRRLDSIERKRRIDRALGLVGISSLASRLPSELSGGQAQCAAIARAMAGDPGLLLADEPTANLDPASAHRVLEVLYEINSKGTTIIVASHKSCPSTQRYFFYSGLIAREIESDSTASVGAQPETEACY